MRRKDLLEMLEQCGEDQEMSVEGINDGLNDPVVYVASMHGCRGN